MSGNGGSNFRCVSGGGGKEPSVDNNKRGLAFDILVASWSTAQRKVEPIMSQKVTKNGAVSNQLTDCRRVCWGVTENLYIYSPV